MKTVLLVSLLGLFVFSFSLVGQTDAVNRENYRLQASKINEAINVDGILDEGIWARAQRTSRRTSDSIKGGLQPKRQRPTKQANS